MIMIIIIIIIWLNKLMEKKELYFKKNVRPMLDK